MKNNSYNKKKKPGSQGNQWKIKGAYKKNGMTFVIVPRITVEMGKRLPPIPFRVLLYLASLEPIHPSITTISKKCGLSRGSVINAIKFLKQLGIIQTKKTYSGVTRYAVLLPMHWKVHGAEEAWKKIIKKKPKAKKASEVRRANNPVPCDDRDGPLPEIEVVCEVDSNKSNKIKVNNNSKESVVTIESTQMVEGVTSTPSSQVYYETSYQTNQIVSQAIATDLPKYEYTSTLLPTTEEDESK